MKISGLFILQFMYSKELTLLIALITTEDEFQGRWFAWQEI